MLGTASTVIYPYIIPMLLGRTFDLFTAQVGVDIFSKDTIRNPIRIHRSYVTSDFRLIRNDSEARRYAFQYSGPPGQRLPVREILPPPLQKKKKKKRLL